MKQPTERAPDIAVGQRVRIADGTVGRIARKTTTRDVTGKAFNYWIVADADGRVGDGRLIYAGMGSGIEPLAPVFSPPAKAAPAATPTVLPGYEALLSDKRRRGYEG